MIFTQILRIVLTLMILAVVSTALIFQNQRVHNDQNHRLDEMTHQVHQALDRVNLNIQTAQRSQRGYILTEHPSMLSGYAEMTARMENDLKSLESAVNQADFSPDLREELTSRFKIIDSNWDLLFERMEATIRLTESGHPELAREVIATSIGEQWIDAAYAAGLEAEELLEQAGQESRQALLQSDAALMYAFWALAIASIALFAALVHQHTRRIDRPLSALRTWLQHYKAGKPVTAPAQAADPQLNSLGTALMDFALALNKSNREKVDLLQAQLQTQEEFSSVLAHEVRTPVNSVVGMLKLAEEEGIFNAHPETLKNLKISTDSLTMLINSTLDYQKIKEGGYRAEHKPVKTQSFLKFALDQAKLQSNEECLEFFLDDEISESTVLLCDAGKVQQVLAHFLINAVKFTMCGQIWIKSRLLEEHGKFTWQISVKDTGIGMTPETLSRIFKPFFQADGGARRKFGGTGLGLALSLQIAEALGGRIDVESNLGAGSKFTLSIPVEAQFADPRLGKLTQSENPSDHFKLDLKGLTGLIVEDHLMNAKINTKLFKGWTGCEIAHSPTGEDALARHENGERFDFVLMDINLGEGITGLETAQILIRRLGSQCPPIFALTAGVLESDRQKVMDAGMSGFIAKPFTENDLLAVMGRCFPVVDRAVPASETEPAS